MTYNENHIKDAITASGLDLSGEKKMRSIVDSMPQEVRHYLLDTENELVALQRISLYGLFF